MEFNKYQEGIDFEIFLAFCKEHGKLVSFRKGELFANQGKVSRFWGIVTKGHFAYTVSDTSGNEKIVGFAFQNSLVGDYLSLIRQVPGLTDIVAIADSTVLVCDAEEFRQLLHTDLRTRVELAESLFEDVYARQLRLHTLTPKERYLRILKDCPEILQYISLKQLASYLMMTPTYLSLIRKQLLTE